MVFIILLLCHWVADFTHLSTPEMLSAKKYGKPLFPIWVHSMVHALFMFYVMLEFKGVMPASQAFLIVLFTHFLIDVWKGKMNVWFPSLINPDNTFHWYLFGFDQLLHISVIYLIAQYL